ncbi:MAG: hypothetical protein R3268_11010, partial [Acidiferrobacterales bacterium]|nr:hypothetical protein [Acidiferrobacterales bacterium]
MKKPALCILTCTALVGTVLFVYPNPANAKISGRALMENCVSSLTTPQTVCNSYIEGLIEG